MSTVIQFPGSTPAAVQARAKVVVGSLYDMEFWKIIGTGSWRDLIALAGLGGIRSSGRISLRKHQRSKETFAEWGFDFRQIDGSSKNRFKFLFEVGSDSGAVLIPMSLSIRNGERVTQMSCPRCKTVLDSWWLQCVVGYGLACGEKCLGLKYSYPDPEQDSEHAVTCLDVDEREHSTVLPKSYRDRFEITRIHKTTFFYDRPNLLAILPGVFQVRSLGRMGTLGHFVADGRQLPVVESEQVQVFDHARSSL